MLTLTPYYNDQSGASALSVLAGRRESLGESGGMAETSHNTLEMRDDPAKSYVRQVMKLIEQDPAEALRMIHYVPKDPLYDAHAATLLAAKLDANHNLVLANEAAAKKPQTALAMQFMPQATGVATFAPVVAAVPAPVIAPKPRTPKPEAPNPFGWANAYSS